MAERLCSKQSSPSTAEEELDLRGKNLALLASLINKFSLTSFSLLSLWSGSTHRSSARVTVTFDQSRAC